MQAENQTLKTNCTMYRISSLLYTHVL